MRIHLRCLGGLDVCVDGVRVPPPTRRAAAVVGYLAVTGRRESRSRLATLFWPDVDPSTARGNLRVVVSNLRRCYPDALEVDRDAVGLTDHVVADADVARFARAAGRGLARQEVAPAEATHHLEEALELHRGELFGGFDLDIGAEFDLWLASARTEHELRHRRVVEALIDGDLITGPTARTLTLAEQLVAEDRYDEAAVARLLRTLAAAGRRAEALRRYDRWRRELVDETGLRPTAVVVEAVEQLRRGSDGGAGAGRTIEHRLPTTTRLVGRDRDLDELGRLFADGERLVTLVGPAGVGKTSTALVAARRWHETTRVPVVHVDLTVADDEHDVLRALLAALGDTRPTSVTVDGAQERLRDRQVLLVLDNVEHLLDHRHLVARLHALCPSVAMLVTSRAPLRSHAEHVYGLEPLEIPAATEPDPARVAEASAVRLFVDRAGRRGVRLAPTASNLALVARACQVLDGLPLAIELATARLPTLGLDGLVQALEDDDSSWQLTVLGRGLDGPAAERHRSVREAVRWSYQQLPEEAQALFRRLSVFAGSFDLDAVVGLHRDTGVGRDEVVDAMASLVDFHLVVRTSGGAAPVRFRMLVTMRSFAAELLAEEGVTERLRDRHAQHYLDTVAAWALRDPEDVLRRFRPDVDNLVLVLDRCHDQGRYEEALRLLSHLGPFWRLGSDASRGLELLSRALDDGREVADADGVDTGNGPATVERATCEVWRLALLADRDGRDAAAEARARLRPLVELLDAALDRSMASRALAEVANVATVTGDADEAVALVGRLQARATSPGERWWALNGLVDVAMIAHHAGDDARALEIIGGLLAEARELGHRRAELRAWMWVGLLEAADRLPSVGTPPTLDDLLVTAVELDDDAFQVWLLVSLGTQAIFAQRLDEAAERFERAFAVARRLDYRHGLAFALMGTVGLAFFSGDTARAARLHAVLEGHLDDLRHVMPRTYHDAYLAVAQHLEELAADDPAMADALAGGRALPWVDAVAEAHRGLHERTRGAARATSASDRPA